MWTLQNRAGVAFYTHIFIRRNYYYIRESSHVIVKLLKIVSRDLNQEAEFITGTEWNVMADNC